MDGRWIGGGGKKNLIPWRFFLCLLARLNFDELYSVYRFLTCSVSFAFLRFWIFSPFVFFEGRDIQESGQKGIERLSKSPDAWAASSFSI
jgi:hypothetical protein